MAVTSRLNLPSRKMLGSALVGLAPAANTTHIPDLKAWYSPYGATSDSGGVTNKTVSIVWVQGYVIAESSDYLVLNDDTETRLKVLNIGNIPRVATKAFTGKYVMVIGELIDSSEVPQLRALKIQDLSSDRLARQSWSYEITDQNAYS